MATADIITFNPTDEAFALQVQREEIEAQRARQTGKWAEGSYPDTWLAFDAFEAEIEKATTLLEDIRLAHSIAQAVDSDAVAIDEARAEERQSSQDRDMALTLNDDEGSQTQELTERTPSSASLVSSWIDWAFVPRAIDANSSAPSDTTVAGPSAPYAVRQRNAFEQLPQLKVDCTVCGDSTHPSLSVRLACGDVYCKPCLKSFFMRVAHDESLFPPKCHRQSIDLALIESELSAEELAVYRHAALEFSSSSRVYCASPECAKFVPEAQRTPDIALCAACGLETCLHCRALAHHGSACQEDKEGQSLIRFAHDQGWQVCHGCGRVCSRDSGCDHMR